MEKTTIKIFRRSIYTFLQNYHHFTITAALLALPFSAAVFLSQSLLVSTSSSLSLILPSIYDCLRTLFHGFPSSSYFEFFTWKLSQTTYSSIITIPFTLTFFLIAKASVIQTLQHKHPNNNNIGFRDYSPSSSSSNIFSVYKHLLITYLCNSFLILSANAIVFSLLFLTFDFFLNEGSPNFLIFLLTAIGALLYSLVLANALIICNLGLVLSGIKRSSGFLPIRNAFVLIKSGRTSIALSLALPIHLLLAAIEALFQYRIVLKAYYSPALDADTNSFSLVFEWIFIAYLYSICIVLDTIISFTFYESCKINSSSTPSPKHLEPISYCYHIEMVEEEGHYYVSIKNSQQLPQLT